MPVDRRTFLAAAGSATLIPAAIAATPPYRIPIRLSDTRVLVDCMIGARGPYGFVLDTGGTIGLLGIELARELGLRQIGTSRLGLRQGPGLYPIFAVRDLSFGDQVRQPLSVIAGVDGFRFGQGAVGSIAAGALTAGDCELDYDAREWRIYRDGAPDRAGWAAYDKAIFHAGNVEGSAFIAADALLGGRSFRFGLDTGMPSTMRVYQRAAKAAGVWDAARWSPAAPGGKGRMIRAAVGLAGVTIPDAVVTLIADPEWGIFPNGVIGLPILRRFNMATAAQIKTLYLRRNGLAPQPERYNRAGMWIDRSGDDAIVAVIGPGSPAAAAGLIVGDRLVGIDFGGLIARMSAPLDQSIALTIERGGQRRDLTVRTSDFL